MRTLAPLALAAVVGFAAVPIGAGARGTVVASIGDKIQTKQAEIDETRKRLDRKRGQLRFQEVRAQELQRQLAETSAGIGRVSAALDVLGTQVRGNERRLVWNEVQLHAAEATLQRHNDALKHRLVDAYERGDFSYVNVLLSATSFSDFVERWDDIRYLIAANQKTVRARRAAERDVVSKQTALESEKLELADAEHRQQLAKYQLASLADERTQLVAAAETQRRSVATQVAALEELSASEEAELEEFIRVRQREAEAARAAEAEARRRAAQLAGQALPPQTSPGAPGSFGWPVSGPITSPFGMRSNPMGGGGFEMHPGIDIGAPMGATITATAGGRIIFAGSYGGYGNAIIIDHGGQASSLYGHCSQIFVSTGQEVQRGQAIGAVGMTGRATGPHLHFEIRINGKPVDPTTR
ncbi:MAG: peptidoglycan DD-metalloendopeptidase family protein, partial [Candidatus Eremiobacteraeota bacterium]|nr:peptidoglycan DD-metalloendopeptidase family protein [Candidatus Eremiobacteraeota bacterium]